MKKLLGVVAAVMLVAICAVSVMAQGITVKLNDEAIDFTPYGVEPQIINSRTMVPLRSIFEALEATVEWDDATKTVTSTRDDVTVKVTIGADALTKNGEAVALDSPAVIVDSRTLVPVRAISESFGCNVGWDDATKTVIITDVKEEAPEIVEIPGAIITLADAESDKVPLYATGVESLQIVEDDRDPSNHVYYLDANVTDRASWTYLWLANVSYEAGQTYKISYEAKITDTVLGTGVTSGGLGTCFQYATEEEPSNKDHGVAKIKNFTDNDWHTIEVIATIPENYTGAGSSRFGIYANPIKVDGYDFNIALDFMVDNISVVPYDGDMTGTYIDGVNVESGSAATKPAAPAVDLTKIDYANLTGKVWDFEEENLGWNPAGCKVEFVGGDMVMATNEGYNDPQVTIKEQAIKAADYNAVVVRVKLDANKVAATAQFFFATSAEGNLSEQKSVHAKFDTAYVDADGYTWLVFDFSNNALWTGDLTILRFDPVHGDGGTHAVDKIILTKI